MSGHRKRQGERPEGALRKSQVVTTFGPGAMVDLVDAAVLVGGLDFWSYDRDAQTPEIREPRLRESLQDAFYAAGRPLSEDRCFREPPLGDDREPSRRAGVAVLEFPQWFVCQNAGCRSLVRKLDGLELKGGRYVHACSHGKRPADAVPARFLGACPSGHVQEWPWIQFAHLNQQGGRCAAPSLTLEESASGDFSEVHVACACGARMPLSTATAGLSLHCKGERPWLGSEGGEPCDHRLRLLVRTASNSYFAQVVSALSLDEAAAEGDRTPLQQAVREYKAVLFSATAQTLPAFRTIADVGPAIADYSDEEVLRAVQAAQQPSSRRKQPLRTPEFQRFVSSPAERPGDLPDQDDHFFARQVEPAGGLPEGVRRLVLAPRLREVRAQIGFTRLEPATPDLHGEFDLQVSSAPLGLTTNWLPATEIWGEGVFLELDEDAVQAWQNRPAVVARAKELLEGHSRWLTTLDEKAREHSPPFMGARYYLLHSLSHLLISAISLECGYAASAIRERIYCGPSKRDPDTPMAAILLSTGTSGTEGTLGGLVEQGRRVREHLQRAYDLGTLCSNDPVCAGHDPAEDPTERYLEGAACHGCLFIAECSCERFNRYLDRALVVPTVGRPESLAFFPARP